MFSWFSLHSLVQTCQRPTSLFFALIFACQRFGLGAAHKKKKKTVWITEQSSWKPLLVHTYPQRHAEMVIQITVRVRFQNVSQLHPMCEKRFIVKGRFLSKISSKELRLNLGHRSDRIPDCNPLPVHLLSLLNWDNTQRTFVSLIHSQPKVACPILFRKSLVNCDLWVVLWGSTLESFYCRKSFRLTSFPSIMLM